MKTYESNKGWKYAITFESKTYRTYTVVAKDLATAEDMAQDELNDDLEVSRAWKENAQIESPTVGAFGIEDVIFMRPDLNEEQALEVIKLADKYFDANIGMSWDTLECWATELFPEGKARPED
tara:strand:- start:144 stop:512 length:369 start_codon:yes stop_codon:yes gene_type:complete